MFSFIPENNIKELYNRFLNCEKLGTNYAVIFVFNDTDNADQIHSTECITPIEHRMIMSSFFQIAQYVYSFNSEDKFIKAIPTLKHKHKFLLVYSMAQNVKGNGRRALIPLICKYYNLINIGSNESSSFLSGDKKLMYELLCKIKELNFPNSIFYDSRSCVDIKTIVSNMSEGKYILKPNDESASIGVTLLEHNKVDVNMTIEILEQYSCCYPSFCIQEFIDGDEVEITLLNINNRFYCPGACKIIYENNSLFLDYDIIGAEAYDFVEYDKYKDNIINAALIVAKKLNFNVISRIDFKITEDKPYIIDIGANPTISRHSSSNYEFRKVFGSESSIYHILVMKALMDNNLFEPPLN